MVNSNFLNNEITFVKHRNKSINVKTTWQWHVPPCWRSRLGRSPDMRNVECSNHIRDLSHKNSSWQLDTAKRLAKSVGVTVFQGWPWISCVTIIINPHCSIAMNAEQRLNVDALHRWRLRMSETSWVKRKATIKQTKDKQWLGLLRLYHQRVT